MHALPIRFRLSCTRAVWKVPYKFKALRADERDTDHDDDTIMLMEKRRLMKQYWNETHFRVCGIYATLPHENRHILYVAKRPHSP